MSLIFIVGLFLLINSLIMIFRGGYVGRFSFEFNGIPGILIGMVVGLFSAIISYGYILEILEKATNTTYITLAVIFTILVLLSWFLNFRFFR
jgi:hypothetical protein